MRESFSRYASKLSISMIQVCPRSVVLQDPCSDPLLVRVFFSVQDYHTDLQICVSSWNRCQQLKASNNTQLWQGEQQLTECGGNAAARRQPCCAVR